MHLVSGQHIGPAALPGADLEVRKAATELEASFLAEMLKSAGLGRVEDAFGGGAGEDQFSSVLVREQAKQIARAGGVGLADTFFEALMERRDADR